MDKVKSELVQAAIFLIIFFGQIFLVSRYYSRDDLVGTAIFALVAVLSGIALAGHLIEWRKACQQKQ